MTDIQVAAGEALTYNRIGGLNHEMILDIAHDHDVDPKLIYEELEWDWPDSA
tara:strand:- start:4721 stop:4876 length:156 start_codon:yes stop_codon:yes gene_type:complete